MINLFFPLNFQLFFLRKKLGMPNLTGLGQSDLASADLSILVWLLVDLKVSSLDGLLLLD